MSFHFHKLSINLSIFFIHTQFLYSFLKQSQKKRVAEEEAVSRKMGLGIRLLPKSAEDAAIAARIKFPSKFDKNMKNKRAMIKSGSIFDGAIGSYATKNTKQAELESKRRKIQAASVSNMLTGGFKSSSLSSQTGMTSSQHKVAPTAVKRRM